jgi:hypothetical protein
MLVYFPYRNAIETAHFTKSDEEPGCFGEVCTTHPIVLIQDGATYHTSAETKAFFAQQTARRHVFQLPTYSPDDNPIEKLWKQIKQHDTPLHYFPTFEALTETVEQALLTFANAPKEVLALCSLPTDLAKVA